MSAVLPAPNPDPAMNVRHEALRQSIDVVVPATTRPTTAQVAPLMQRLLSLGHLARRRPGLLLLFVLTGAGAAWIGGLFRAPAYRAQALIEVSGAGGNAFITTQAKLLESTTLRRRAEARVQREHASATYAANDHLAALRRWLGAYLPPMPTRSRVPAALEVETFGGANVLRLHVTSPDPRYAARFANALGEEYMALADAGHSSNGTQSPARFVDRAEPSTSAPSARRTDDLWWGSIAGLLVGFSVLAARGTAQASRLSAPGDVRARLRMRELGAIPWAGSVPDPIPGHSTAGNGFWHAAFGRQHGGQTAAAETAVWQDQASLLAEAFRSATASLLLVKPQATRPQVIVVTSAHRGEGKTTAVLNLGAALADLNLKVLVMDADLRHPRLHQILELSNSWGLSDLLQERIPLRDVPVEALIRTCSIPNLAVVCSGPPTLNVASLLYSGRMEELMARFRREFDVILIDTPPALMLSDARLAARLADTVAIVVRAGETAEEDVTQLAERLAEDSIPVAGALLNGWRCNESAHGARLAGVKRG